LPPFHCTSDHSPDVLYNTPPPEHASRSCKYFCDTT